MFSPRILGSFGAIVAIVSLALGPFAQQIATYKIRTVESDIGAAIPRALNFTGALPGNTTISKDPGCMARDILLTPYSRLCHYSPPEGRRLQRALRREQQTRSITAIPMSKRQLRMGTVRVPGRMPRMHRHQQPHHAILSARAGSLPQHLHVWLASAARRAAQHQLRRLQHDVLYPVCLRRHAVFHHDPARLHRHRVVRPP